MKRFWLMLLSVLLVFCFVGVGIAEQEMSPWKNEKGVLGKHGKAWRVMRSQSAIIPRQLPLVDFSILTGATSAIPIAADGTTAPGMAIKSLKPCLIWADNEVSKIAYTYRLPTAYVSAQDRTLRYRALVSHTGTTASEIDWAVSRLADDSTATVRYIQDAVAMTFATASVSFEEILLTTPVSCGSVFLPGDWVTLEMWATATGNGDTHMYGVEAYY